MLSGEMCKKEKEWLSVYIYLFVLMVLLCISVTFVVLLVDFLGHSHLKGAHQTSIQSIFPSVKTTWITCKPYVQFIAYTLQTW